MLFEDNVVCITQLRGCFINGHRTKHISPKLFFTHDLQKNDDFDIQKNRSSDNPTNLFIKSLLASDLEKMVQKIRMQKFK